MTEPEHQYGHVLLFVGRIVLTLLFLPGILMQGVIALNEGAAAWRGIRDHAGTVRVASDTAPAATWLVAMFTVQLIAGVAFMAWGASRMAVGGSGRVEWTAIFAGGLILTFLAALPYVTRDMSPGTWLMLFYGLIYLLVVAGGHVAYHVRRDRRRAREAGSG